MNESDQITNRIESLTHLIDENAKNLAKIKETLEALVKDYKKDIYKNIEGVTGIFDGYSLVDTSGNKYEIPANYAAKSRLVYGDTIKMIDDNGTTLFKQIQKVERKRLEGVLSKKEGKWVVLTETGSYKISDVAADHMEAKINDEVVVFIPLDNLNAPFATLDHLITQKQPQAVIPRTPAPTPKSASLPKPSVPRPAPVPVSKPAPKSTPKPDKVTDLTEINLAEQGQGSLKTTTVEDDDLM